MINDSCNNLDRQQDICPSREQIFAQMCTVLPRGRAWQTHNTDVPREKSIQQKFWWAMAGFIEWVNDEMCRVIDEYFCNTVSDLKQVALVEYGIPDDCGLYRDLCTKIRALPDDHCDYYAAVAAQLGYKVQCSVPRDIECYPCTHTAAGMWAIGHAGFCAQSGVALRIDYCPDDLPDPNCGTGLSIMGHTAVGCEPSCVQPQLPEDLACVLDVIVPAHMAIETITQ